jgi:hypothetical protein
MGKRHEARMFMPGKFVFPGDRVEAEDRRMSAAGALDPNVEEKLNARVRPSPGFAGEIALAAVRETSRKPASPLASATTARPKTRRPAPGLGSQRPASLRRSTRFDARFLAIDARFIARRIEGVVHLLAELVKLVWTPLDEACQLDLPNITRYALDDLARALKGGLDRRGRRRFYRQERGKRGRDEL